MKKLMLFSVMVLLVVGMASAVEVNPYNWSSGGGDPITNPTYSFDDDYGTYTYFSSWEFGEDAKHYYYNLSGYDNATFQMDWLREWNYAEIGAVISCEGTQFFLDMDESTARENTSVITLPQACLVADADFAFYGDGNTNEFTIYEMIVNATVSCVANWSCSGYSDCVDDALACNAVTDLNACGESYAGNFSEFESLECPTVVEGTGSGFVKRPVVVDEVVDDVSAGSAGAGDDSSAGGFFSRILSWFKGLLWW